MANGSVSQKMLREQSRQISIEKTLGWIHLTENIQGTFAPKIHEIYRCRPRDECVYLRNMVRNSPSVENKTVEGTCLTSDMTTSNWPLYICFLVFSYQQTRKAIFRDILMLQWGALKRTS